MHLPQSIFNLISQKYPQFFISPETQSIRIDSKSRNSPEFDIFDRLAPTLNLDLAHLTKITYTHTVIHHLSRSNSSTIRIILTREESIGVCAPMNLFDYPPRVEIYSIWKNCEPRHVPPPPQDVRASRPLHRSRCDAMHDTSVPHFLRVFIKTDDEHGERKSRASRERLLKKGLLERSTTTTTGTTATTNDRRRPTD